MSQFIKTKFHSGNKRLFSLEQQAQVKRFKEKLVRWEALIENILASIPRLKAMTIERVFGKRRIRIGHRSITRPRMKKMRKRVSLDWPDACPMLASIHQNILLERISL